MTRALIVDDKLENRYLLRALLQGHGFEVAEADNGAEALVAARQQAPDVIISDLLMPVMDGYSLLREWKGDAELSAIPFIVYTATYTEPQDEKLAHELGADAFIVKPSEPEPFIRHVQEVLAQAQGGALASREPLQDEEKTLKLYNEVLVRKLEKKSAQLEQRIAELTESQEQIRRLNQLYAALSETNQAIVHLSEREALFQAVCRIAVERGGLVLAWIGLLDVQSGEIVPVARSGACEEWFPCTQPFTTHKPYHTPVEFAVGEERTYLCNDLQAEPSLAAIHGVLRQAGLHAAASLPLRVGGQVIGALSLYAAKRGFFDKALTELVTEMAADISFAIENLEKEQRRRAAEEQLRASEAANRLSNHAIEASANGIMITVVGSTDHPIIYVNPAFERITGYRSDEVTGRDPKFLLGEDHEQSGINDIRMAIREQREGDAVLRNYRKDGRLFWNELTIAPVLDGAGGVTHFVGVINDISERKQYEEQLERQYNEDALTGLASPNLLRDRTKQAIGFAAHQDRSLALLLADLDEFKRINDSLGHDVGDSILCTLAARISECVFERDTVARLGGDEFAILLTDLKHPQDGMRIGNKVLEAIGRPLIIDGRQFDITASIGVSFYPEDSENYETLLRNADTAMHHAKEAGRNALRFYAAGMNSEVLRRLELDSKLRRALEQEEFSLHYQPLVNLHTGEVHNVEALLRWHTSDDTFVSPVEFIPLAEESGLIIPIGEWVLYNACLQARQWQQMGMELCVSVNLSARQLHDEDLSNTVQWCLERSQLSPHLLKLEITETAVMENAVQAVRILNELKSVGVSVSVDDFGTGYSSLAYLRRFPIDQLKIDRSFIQEISLHPDSVSIVQGIIGLAKSLRLQTVAEGVETTQQRDFLKGAGCDLMQGFLYSKPLPADQLERLLQRPPQ